MIFLYADEDIPLPLVRALRLQGLHVVTTVEQNMRGKTDEEQVLRASSLQAIFFTHNVADFVQLHNRFRKGGVNHSGIIVSKKDSLGVLLRKMLHLNATLTMEDMVNRLEYFHNW